MRSQIKLNACLLCLFLGWTTMGFSQLNLKHIIEEVIAKEDVLPEKAFAALVDETLIKYETALAEAVSLKARLLQRQGIAYYYMDEAHYKEALQAYQKALALWESDASAAANDIIYTYYLITVLQRYNGKYKQAIEHGKIALQKIIAGQEEDLSRKAKIYLELGESYRNMGDLAKATAYAEQAAGIFSQRKSYEELINCYNLLAILLQESGKKEASFVYYEKIIKHSESTEEQIANAYGNIGWLFINFEDYAAALPPLKKSKALLKQLYQQTGLSYFNKSLSSCLEGISICYRHMGRYKVAKSSISEAMTILRKELPNKFHPDVAKFQDNIGDLYFDQGEFKNALAAYHEGITCLLPQFVTKDPTQNPDLSLIECEDNRTLLTLLAAKARSLHALYQRDTAQLQYLENAYSTYLRFDELLTEIRQGFRASESTYVLLGQMHENYEGAIEVTMQLYQRTKADKYYERAYHFASKNKAIVLLDALQAEQAKFAGLPADLLKEEAALKKANLDLEAKLFEAKANAQQETAKIQVLQKERFVLKMTYEKLIDNFEQNFPQYYKLRYAYEQTSDISSFQKKLPTDGVLLEYFIGQNKGFLFAITSTDHYFFSWDKTPSFEEDCTAFRSMISNFDQANDPALAHALFQQILEQPLAEIEQQQNLRRLFIIPDGVLLRISFDPLLTKKVATWKNKTNPYLLQKYAISYAYTNQLLFAEDKAKAHASDLELFGGFALDYRNSFTSSSVPVKDTFLDKRNLGILENAPEEVSAIADLLDGEDWLNEEVSKQGFLDNAARFKILHWAGHGWIREDEPMNSALVFSLSPTVEDSLLRVIELYGLELNAEMVVLSACNTAYGKLNEGEGISSLSRAFAYAGCPTVVSSLWNAADASTKEILVDFYKNIKAKEEKDFALQKAKLSYLKNNAPTNADPSLWANMIVIGDSSALDIDASSLFLWVIMGLIILLVGLFGYRSYRRSLG